MPDPILLSHSDILELNLSYNESRKAIKHVLMEKVSGNLILKPKINLPITPSKFFNIMPSIIPDLNMFGLKSINKSPKFNNRPGVTGVMVLNDFTTGKLLCIMDSTWLTAYRTGIVAAITCKYLARPDSETISLYGAGNCAISSLMHIIEEIPSLKTVKVFKYKDALERLSKRFSHTNLRFEGYNSLKDLFVETNIFLSSITGDKKRTFIENNWVNEGLLALPIHTKGWQECKFDKVFTDYYEQTKEIAPNINAELGEIILGTKKGRENTNEKIIVYNYGIAIYDLIIANMIYNEANKKKIGTQISIDDYHDEYFM
jgi:ornithine cyclodeaminase/alanine dehydrogenase-like protein (mu-crystallin family)